nr:MAG TPA: hypothetical protein [Caudoviricetes sp.]DAZ71427.1 MAG TPA: hypothetical protein [Caudoviricetes sp.]
MFALFVLSVVISKMTKVDMMNSMISPLLNIKYPR